jgi:thiamine biosynthesis lipoprotein
MSRRPPADPAALPDLTHLDGDDDERVAQGEALPRRAFVAHYMAMPWSVHVRGAAATDPGTPAAVNGAFAVVERTDLELSPFRPDSALNAFRAGRLSLDDGPASLRAVHRLSQEARDVTDGVFDAWGWRDGFDPTGLTKGWAISEALACLAGVAGDVAVVAGGDLAVRSPSGLPWRVGVEDPADRTHVLGWVDVTDGGVATSGVAARGAHIVGTIGAAGGDGGPAVTSATVVAADIVWADVWATTAVALGHRARTALHAAHGTSGILVDTAGEVFRWRAA